MRDKIVAGNWKMNMNAEDARNLYAELKEQSNIFPENTKVIIAPPSIYLSEFSQLKNEKVLLSSQNCSEHGNGAFTGEVSAAMLNSIGVEYCLVGHSERRQYQNENNALLKQKVDSLIANAINPVYCCGEVLEEREAGREKEVVGNQISEALFHLSPEQFKKVVIAYEPVWAIGTGKTASSQQAQDMHEYIRSSIADKYGNEVAQNISILYGGSCKPDNAAELFAMKDIDGGLIGGAALKSETFVKIIQS